MRDVRNAYKHFSSVLEWEGNVDRIIITSIYMEQDTRMQAAFTLLRKGTGGGFLGTQQ
jgi:hypothetical protein